MWSSTERDTARSAASTTGNVVFDCIAAFDRELKYTLATLLRLGARPADVEDLAQEIFLALHENWSIIDGTRPLRN